MKITPAGRKVYLLQYRISDDPIEKDISHGWNVNVGMSARGIGQITILDAKADGLLPLQLPKAILQQAVVG
ncbi:MAG: hypothetical protein HQL96_16445 [Magnetococcales bacterium]|nr:hypothetical protein [Magnetococcales bacterium]